VSTAAVLMVRIAIKTVAPVLVTADFVAVTMAFNRSPWSQKNLSHSGWREKENENCSSKSPAWWRETATRLTTPLSSTTNNRLGPIDPADRHAP